MRKALLVLASIAAVAFTGCTSSGNNPWATPDAAPAPQAVNEPAPAPAATETPSDALFTDTEELPPEPADDSEGVTPPPAGGEGELLADYPAIRKANLEKALRALKKASTTEELSMPDKGNARITRFNAEVGVIEFITPTQFAEETNVVLTKENKAALVTVIAVEGDRYIADLAPHVKGSPDLKPGDFVLCDIYRSPEELQKIAAEQRKAQQEAIRAARAAAQQERALLSGDDEEEEEEAPAAEEDSSSDDEEEDEDEEDEDEDDDF